jgi:DHA2 family multidrug resistance protein
MYSALTVLPLFLQTLLGYTAQSSGLATAPRGIGAMIAMPLVGILMTYVDGRWLMSLGIACVAASTLMFANLTLDVSMASIVLPNVVQGLGIGLVMVPLMALAVGTLPKERIGNGSGIFNLMRNLGGSMGISFITTLVARWTQINSAVLSADVTPFGEASNRMLDGLRDALASGGGDVYTAMQRSYAEVFGLVQRQAGMLAFIRTFEILGIMFIFSIPLILLMKKPKPGTAPVAGH